MASLKIYRYSTADAWPATGVRWPPFEVGQLDEAEYVTGPEAADFFIAPFGLDNYERWSIDPRKRLPHLNGREHQHVWVEIAECWAAHEAQVGPGVFVSTGATDIFMQQHSRGVAWPWGVDDVFSTIADAPFTHDVAFHGWMSGDIRRLSVDSCTARFGDKAHIQTYGRHWGHLHWRSNRKRWQREGHVMSLGASRTALCPRTIAGHIPIRFYEAMAAGRVPVLVSDRHVLPMANVIDYDKFCVFIAEKDAASAGTAIAECIARGDDWLREAGQQAHVAWREHLSPAAMPRSLRRILEQYAASP